MKVVVSPRTRSVSRSAPSRTSDFVRTAVTPVTRSTDATVPVRSKIYRWAIRQSNSSLVRLSMSASAANASSPPLTRRLLRALMPPNAFSLTAPVSLISPTSPMSLAFSAFPNARWHAGTTTTSNGDSSILCLPPSSRSRASASMHWLNKEAQTVRCGAHRPPHWSRPGHPARTRHGAYHQVLAGKEGDRTVGTGERGHLRHVVWLCQCGVGGLQRGLRDHRPFPCDEELPRAIDQGPSRDPTRIGQGGSSRTEGNAMAVGEELGKLDGAGAG